ncbi:MAG: hypothetical protein AAB577_00895 [Patescibacteria group bacterium]
MTKVDFIGQIDYLELLDAAPEKLNKEGTMDDKEQYDKEVKR